MCKVTILFHICNTFLHKITYSSLQELFDSMGETDRFDIDNGLGESFDVTMIKELGFKKMVFHGEGYAGRDSSLWQTSPRQSNGFRKM